MQLHVLMHVARNVDEAAIRSERYNYFRIDTGSRWMRKDRELSVKVDSGG